MLDTAEVYLAAIPLLSGAWKAMVLWLAIAVGPASAGPRHDRRVAEREARRAQVEAIEYAQRYEAMLLLEALIARTEDGTLPPLEPEPAPDQPGEPTTLASR